MPGEKKPFQGFCAWDGRLAVGRSRGDKHRLGLPLSFLQRRGRAEGAGLFGPAASATLPVRPCSMPGVKGSPLARFWRGVPGWAAGPAPGVAALRLSGSVLYKTIRPARRALLLYPTFSSSVRAGHGRGTQYTLPEPSPLAHLGSIVPSRPGEAACKGLGTGVVFRRPREQTKILPAFSP